MSARNAAGINVGDPTQPGPFELGISVPAWTASALCAQTDPALWFPGEGGSPRAAIAICGHCPVRRRCLDYAVEAEAAEGSGAFASDLGVYGGMTGRQRRPLVRARRVSNDTTTAA